MLACLGWRVLGSSCTGVGVGSRSKLTCCGAPQFRIVALSAAPRDYENSQNCDNRVRDSSANKGSRLPLPAGLMPAKNRLESQLLREAWLGSILAAARSPAALKSKTIVARYHRVASNFEA